MSLMPLIYYYANEGSTFKWEDILSVNMEKSITVVKEAEHGIFLSFHMPSYLLDIVCVLH
jgi:hypothetical protein